jgi:hypothetical protein
VLLRRPKRLLSVVSALRERGLDTVSLACDITVLHQLKERFVE